MGSSRLKEVFLTAVGLADAERIALLERECAGDASLLVEVKALLERDAASAALTQDACRAIAGPHADPPAEELRPGASIGGYRAIRLIGRGGSSNVYAAIRDGMDVPAALKVLHARALSDRESWRFEHEVRLLSRLDHPGLARVREFGVDASGLAYIVMDLVVGPTLDAAAAELPLRDTLGLILQVCDAIGHAHQRGVVHRDLKSSNVIVASSEDGAPARPVVVDFGIARTHDSSLTRLTEPGLVVGTLGTMAPEQARGDASAVDTRTDVWGLGVLLFELLTRDLPFGRPGDTPAAMTAWLASVQHDEPRRARSLDPDIHPDLDAIAAKALARDPADRYASAREFADDLRRFLDGLPTVARPPHALERLGKWARRNRKMVAGGILASGLILAATWGFVGAWQAELREQARAISNYAFLLDRLADDAAKRAATREFRERIVREALAHVESDVLRRPHDPDLRRLRAKALRHSGELAVESGELARARPLHVRSLEDRHFITTGRHAQPTDWLELATQTVRVADLTGPDEEPGRLELYQRAHDLYLRVAAESPELIAAHTWLGWSYQRLAAAASDAGNQARRIELLTERATRARVLAEQHPTSPDVLYNLAEGELQLAGCYEVSSAEHAAALGPALAAAERLAAAAPDDRRTPHSHARALSFLTAYRLFMGDLAGAESSVEQALEIARRAYQTDPDDHMARWAMDATIGAWIAVLKARGDTRREVLAREERLEVRRRSLRLEHVVTELPRWLEPEERELAEARRRLEGR